MQTRIDIFDGIPLEVPDIPEFFWPHPTIQGFPTCCGPGPVGELGDFLVPDMIRKMPASMACWPHDFMFKYGKGKAEFIQANEVFLINLWSINDCIGGDVHRKLERIPLIYAYYKAVSSPAGYLCFANSRP